MFHLILGFMALGMFAAAIVIALIPMWLGPLIQALISFFSNKKVVHCIPGMFGILGLVFSLYYFCIADQVFPVFGVLLYWAIFFLLLWVSDIIAGRIKNWLHQKWER